MLKLTLLISGSLGYELLQHVANIKAVQIISVFTDFKSHEIISSCEKEKYSLFIGNPRKRTSSLKSFILKKGEVDVLLSINYLFIIEKELIDWARIIALNIHGSLLPKYRGRTPHVWAIINGERITGITVHKIEEGVDSGDILLQKEVLINEFDTGASILHKYNNMYPLLVDKIIGLVNKNELTLKPQNHDLATYFPKRSPEDGEIKWEWSKERILNWVRAQAAPYPGSFTYIRNKKLIIDKVVVSDVGYDSILDNGTIVKINPLAVKTPNGTLEIIDFHFENGKTEKFIKGSILGV